MLTTRQKLVIGKAASGLLRKARRTVGLGPQVQVFRSGANWDLDLREGIDLAIYLGQYQTLPRCLVESLRSKPGCTAVDIGANIGAFALPLAHAVGDEGHVIACEATSYAFRKLQRNLSLNDRLEPRTTAIQAVLGDSDDTKPAKPAIYSSWRVDGAANDGDHPLHGGRPMSTEGAVVTSFDALVQSDPMLQEKIERLELIKLDVDGHELPILQGARKTIAARRPKLLIEIAPHVHDDREGGFEALIEEIGNQGYQLHDPDTGEPISHDVSNLRVLVRHGAGVDYLGLMAD